MPIASPRLSPALDPQSLREIIQADLELRLVCCAPDVFLPSGDLIRAAARADVTSPDGNALRLDGPDLPSMIEGRGFGPRCRMTERVSPATPARWNRACGLQRRLSQHRRSVCRPMPRKKNCAKLRLPACACLQAAVCSDAPVPVESAAACV